MSFANPGSRQASSIGSLRRMKQLPGNFLTNPRLMPVAWAYNDSIRYPTNQTGGNVLPSISIFWGPNQYYGNMGVRTTSAYTSNVWKTIVTASGTSGVISNILGPQIQIDINNPQRFILCRVTLDGAQTVIKFPPPTIIFAPVVRPYIGSYRNWLFTASSTPVYDGEPLSSGAGSGPTNYYWSQTFSMLGHANQASYIIPTQPLDAMARGAPVLYFKNSMAVEFMSAGNAINNNNNDNAPYSGVQFQLGDFK